MSVSIWEVEDHARFQAIRNDLLQVSTATACQLLISHGWRNNHMVGLLPIQPLGMGNRIVGRARTCRYLSRRSPERILSTEERRVSPEIALIEQLEPDDILCIDALGVRTAGIIGDILAARVKAREAAGAIIYGVVRDSPYIADLGLPVFSLGTHPSHSGRDLVPVDYDRPIEMSGAQIVPGDILLADDEGVIAMPLELAEFVAAEGPPKEHLEEWIRGKVLAGGSIPDYYPPSSDKITEYEQETGYTYHPPTQSPTFGDNE